MTLFEIRCTVIFTCIIIVLFDTVRVSGNDTNEQQDVLPILTNVARSLPFDIVKNIKSVGCNLLYHSILHVHLSRTFFINPPDVLVQVYTSNLNLFHNWSKKMLLFMSCYLETRSIMGPMWAFFLYTYTLKEQMTNRQRVDLKLFESIHTKAFEILNGKLKTDCPVLNVPGEQPRIYESYIADVINKNNLFIFMDNVKDSDKFLKLLFEPTTALISNDIFSDDHFLLSNVIGDTDVVDTLTEKFELIPRDGVLKNMLTYYYEAVSDPKTSLEKQLDSLRSLHISFMSILKIMMVRLCLYHLAYIENKTPCLGYHRSADRVTRGNSAISGKLKEFIQLLRLQNDDNLMQFSELLENSEANGEIEYAKNLQLNGMAMLNALCDCLTLNSDYREIDSMELPSIQLKDIAESAGIVIKTEVKNCMKTILYANIFVDYLKETLSGIDFSLIHLSINTRAL